MKKCGHINKCGCSSNTTKMSTNCSGYPSCENPEPCSETFDGKCVIYTGDTLLDLTVPKGSRLNEVIQRLVGAITNPGCNYPDSPCKSVIVKSTKITSSTIKLSWGSVGEVDYQVQYRRSDVVNWSVNTQTSETSDTIGGLSANTTYVVKVLTVCEQNCFSVELQITTKA